MSPQPAKSEKKTQTTPVVEQPQTVIEGGVSVDDEFVQQHSAANDPPAIEPDASEKEEQPEMKISTKVASPAELFEAKLTELISKVLSHEMQPGEAVRELHTYWKEELTEQDRDSLISHEALGNIHEAASRLMAAANMLGSEIPALAASHASMKGMG